MPLAWSPRAEIHGENVTDRYTLGAATATRPAETLPRLMVEVKRGGERVEAEVRALTRATGATVLSGKSLGPRADINQHLCRPANAGESFLVVARLDGREVASLVTVGKTDTVVRLDLDTPNPSALAPILADRFGPDRARREAAREILAQSSVDDATRAEAFRS
ncbi:MAG: hypothetical protein U0794_12645 [Isosphaeraceae bacterium]